MRGNAVSMAARVLQGLGQSRWARGMSGWACFWVLASLLAPPLASQELQGRSLGGYRFIPSNLVADPFITTHFRNATGFGVALDVELPILVIEQDTLLALKGNVLFVDLEFEYQHAANDRVAFRFTGSGASRVGTDIESILSQGVSAVTGFKAGATVRAWNNENVLISGVGDVVFGNTFRIDFAKFAEDVINGNLARASIVTKDDGAVLVAGLRAAWGIAPWAGIHGEFQGGYRNTVYEEDFVSLAGISGSMDFGQRGNAPVGLMGSLSYDKLAVTGDNVGATWMAGLEVVYTGREDFALGLQMSFTRTPLQDPDVTLHGRSLNLTTRYYF